MQITPVHRVEGEITVPSDKSMTHRAVILASLAEGTSAIVDPLKCYDTRATMMAMRALGAELDAKENTLYVRGCGLHGLKRPEVPVNVQNSGTTMRLLAGVLAAQDYTCTILGDESLNRRPMDRICKPLRQMGARITAHNEGDKAPLTITGRPLRGIQYVNQIASAQVKSCLLLAGLYADRKTTIYEPTQSRNHTEIMLGEFGVPVQCTHMNNTKGRSFGESVTIMPGNTLKSTTIQIPGDFSSAAFLIGAALTLPDSDLIIRNVGINPTRTGFLIVCRAMGGDITLENEYTCNGEKVADIHVRYSKLRAIDVPAEVVPSMIDEIPILAVIATQALGVTRIRSVGELRVKETDRVDALITNLAAAGAVIRVEDEDLIIAGAPIKGGIMNSYGDHRIAMACTVAAMLAREESTLNDPDCVSISFPGFYETLSQVCR